MGSRICVAGYRAWSRHCSPPRPRWPTSPAGYGARRRCLRRSIANGDFVVWNPKQGGRWIGDDGRRHAASPSQGEASRRPSSRPSTWWRRRRSVPDGKFRLEAVADEPAKGLLLRASMRCTPEGNRLAPVNGNRFHPRTRRSSRSPCPTARTLRRSKAAPYNDAVYNSVAALGRLPDGTGRPVARLLRAGRRRVGGGQATPAGSRPPRRSGKRAFVSRIRRARAHIAMTHSGSDGAAADHRYHLAGGIAGCSTRLRAPGRD